MPVCGLADSRGIISCLTPPYADVPTYPTLFSPVRAGTHVLKNRIIMGSMHTRMEHASDPLARQIAFYAARAEGGVAVIVSGGHSPNEAGLMEPGAPILNSRDELNIHRAITGAVHDHGAKMLLQILHAGRSARHKGLVGASEIKSPINRLIPRPLTASEVEHTIDDFVRCAELAAEGGYDGVEIMGSEGYLINQFTVLRTNTRTDAWGGSLENRIRFPTEIVSRTRARLGRDFLIIYRISALDLVEGGATADEIDALARAVENAGADILNTGIGWHEAAVPTIAYPVPRAAWAFAAARLKSVVKIPVVASNRINTPETAEKSAGRRQRRSRVDGPADAGRPGLRPQSARGPARRHQCLHRLQPGLPRLHLYQPDRDVPGQPAGLP